MNKCEFDYYGFSKKDLARLNQEKGDDIYGYILLTTDNNKYIIDVQFETKELYDRDGIVLSIYKTNDNCRHLEWVDDSKEIVTATNYPRFVHRAQKVVLKIVAEYEKERTANETVHCMLPRLCN